MNTRHWHVQISDRGGTRAQWRALPERHEHPFDAALAAGRLTNPDRDGRFSRVTRCEQQCEGVTT